MPSHRCYAPDAAADPEVVTLSEAESHHVSRVLRLGPGAAVVVFDGRGREWAGRLAQVSRTHVSVGALQSRRPVPEPPVAVTLAISLLKGDQMDAVVRDATVLGAAAIVPFRSAHTVRSGGDIAARTVERWDRVAVAAARQCRRAVVPPIVPGGALEDVLALETGLRLACVEPALQIGTTQTGLPRASTALLAVGPEGGWSAAEVDALRQAGAHSVALGPRTLRAEAAPIVALSSLWTRWGWT